MKKPVKTDFGCYSKGMNYYIQSIDMDASFAVQHRKTSATPRFGQFLTRKLLNTIARLSFQPSLFHFWRINNNEKRKYLQDISRLFISRQGYACRRTESLWREHCDAFGRLCNFGFRNRCLQMNDAFSHPKHTFV